MVITLDTNVLFAELNSKAGASFQILKLILAEKLELALSIQIYFEYYAVLTRKDNLKLFNLSVNQVEDVLDLMAIIAQDQDIWYLLRPNLSDEDDNIFVECAFASNSEYLITSNVKDFKNSQLKGFKFKIVTPSQFYKIWSAQNE
jgi:putative PIN family toxin of toxin-antitoxin system